MSLNIICLVHQPWANGVIDAPSVRRRPSETPFISNLVPWKIMGRCCASKYGAPMGTVNYFAIPEIRKFFFKISCCSVECYGGCSVWLFYVFWPSPNRHWTSFASSTSHVRPGRLMPLMSGDALSKHPLCRTSCPKCKSSPYPKY